MIGLGQTFHFYDGVNESGTKGKWTESYNNDILIITLRHDEVNAIEKLAIQKIHKRKLAIGRNINGDFECRSHIKKQ